MYLTESDGEDDSFYQLPSFLDSIASVLIHLDKVTNSPSVIHFDIRLNNNSTPRFLSVSVCALLYPAVTRKTNLTLMIVSFELLLCVHGLRFQRCTHLYWSVCLWCRLTASLSTARECRLLVAGPSLRCWWPWPLKDLFCGVLLALWVRQS